MTNGRSARRNDHRLVPMIGSEVQRYSPERICADCDTVLSIYNATAFCSLHTRPGRWLVNRVV